MEEWALVEADDVAEEAEALEDVKEEDVKEEDVKEEEISD
jgi:hypothetical protein